ncbi:ABC transporter permease [Micromonospora andamanensis]|uniref:Transport permease protein n=1 Tax=Micromonospora andamanensis TaxID=1287068 RepID=A0ABQ4HTJ6_9ACTN|nr:ABC transporter permease [Micromonospora andamanensis]GIJ08957.1 transport permease protein [Micromonospora andamanensis]
MLSTAILARSAAVTGRNVRVLRTKQGYWLLVASAFVEPLLYFVALGWGVGSLVATVPLGDRSVSYLTFIAPAMLAASAMNGAVAEATTNFFTKAKYARLYEAALNTPLRPVEVAWGELGWATVRGTLYSVAFLVVMTALGVTTPLRALVALPAALLVGVTFGAVGLALATYMKSWQHFDYVTLAQIALLLFSGAYVPVSTYPKVFEVVVACTPLYHGIELLRGVTVGSVGLSTALSVLYLLVLALVAVGVAGRRTAQLLRR